MNKKRAIIGISILVILGIGSWISFFSTRNTHVFERDTTINGNFTIPEGSSAVVKNGSTITTTGDMTISGTLTCADGPIFLVAKGELHISGTLHCGVIKNTETNPLNIGLEIVATHIVLERSATIETDGHVVIVDDRKKLPLKNEALSSAYDEVAENSGTGTQFGPFTEKDGATTSTPTDTSLASEGEDALSVTAEFRGTWNLKNPDTLQDELNQPLMLVDLGEKSSITLEDVTINGEDGRAGEDDIKKSCTAHGGNGHDGFHLRIKGGAVLINNGTISLGNGGNGGNAETPTDCMSGTAMGGKGGEPGNIKITANRNITITTLHVNGGVGGNGGNASVVTKDDDTGSCQVHNAGEAMATGGNGGNNRKVLITKGNIEGLQYLDIDRTVGGNGGNALARSGKGQDSMNCSCASGNGGKSSAFGGNGGDAIVLIPGNTAEARGGDGGDIETAGGNGGKGSSCTSNAPGINGGDGGTAIGDPGLPGRGTTANGNPGVTKNESGGGGGQGGDGCPPGAGGSGGIGSPLGATGWSGHTTCIGDTTNIPVTSPATPVMIKAILYKGKYLPLDQLVITNEPGCGADHWRAERGSVQATDGTIVPDANVVCGYGKVSENTPVLTTKEVPRVNANDFASTTELFKLTP